MTFFNSSSFQFHRGNLQAKKAIKYIYNYTILLRLRIEQRIYGRFFFIASLNIALQLTVTFLPSRGASVIYEQQFLLKKVTIKKNLNYLGRKEIENSSTQWRYNKIPLSKYKFLIKWFINVNSYKNKTRGFLVFSEVIEMQYSPEWW